MKENDRNFLFIVLTVSGFLLILAGFSPLLLTRNWTTINFTETGQIGDTIGGSTAPILATLGAFLTFSAFYVQYNANKIQLQHINLIRKKEQKDSFETKLLSWLDIHRKNVDELFLETIDQKRRITGQQFISFIVDQIEGIYNILSSQQGLSKKQITQISYLHIFYGLSLENNPNLSKFYTNYFNNIINFNEGLISYKGWYFSDRYLKYGYGEILSRYLRYQYQLIQFIDDYDFDKNDFTEDEIEIIKYKAAKIYRSNLTNNEQLLLFINSLTPLGREWNKRRYIEKYKLIKNIILPRIFGYSPKEWARDELKMSEKDISDFFEFKDKV